MKENKISSLIAHLFQGVFLLITAVLCVGPFVWVIFSSFKSNKEDFKFRLCTSKRLEF